MYAGNSFQLLSTFANNKDPDEIPHNGAFDQGLHCLLRQKRSSEKEIQYFWKIITCESLIYRMDNSK